MQGDAGQLAALWGEQFDAATLVWTLHHVADPQMILRQVGRVLRSGGKVLIGDWVVGEGQERGECFRFTAEEIEQLLDGAGFQNIAVEWIEPFLVLVTGEKSLVEFQRMSKLN
ncbi:MAG: class I SAM-dependent methyltransferase [Chloroflexi bacterium]|nr:class I SAM-dependent methyltransferase [Chloroflexota bacterium]MBM4431637.1 class I SAM-dependent methyltransferase [Chloroflexota bacterium]